MADGDDTTEWWYKDKGGEKTGPLPVDLLEALWVSGEIDGMTEVWKEGMDAYVPVAQVDSLRQNFQALAQEDDIEEGDEEGDGDGTAAQGAGGAPAAAGAEEAGAQTTKTITGKELWDMQWATTTTEDGVTYHANKYTFESSWVPPTQPTEWDEEAAALVRAPWMLCWTAAGTSLWLNTTSGEQQQECPFPKGPDFIAAEKFEGSKKGYFFKRGGLGLGYYKDGVAHASGDAGGEDSAAAQAGEKRKRKRKNKPKWKKSKINTYVYAEGLPTDTTAEEVAAYFGKFGVLRPDENDGKTPKIKLYTDAAGNLKGDARVGYLKEASIPICLQLADGAPFRDGKFPLKVALATFEMKGDTFKPSEAPDEEAKARRAKNLLALKKKERGLDWGADEGVDDGRGLRIVILRGMFTIAEMDADLDAAKTLREEIEGEAKKIGEVEKVTVFERNPEGVVAVKFKVPASAEQCIGIMNNRFFGGRQITCDFWDGVTNYVVKESAEKEEERLESFGAWLEQQSSSEEEEDD